MELLYPIEGIIKLPNGQIFATRWGNGLIVNPEDFGGVEELPAEIKTTTVGPWIGLNGDNLYRIFCLHDNSLIEFRQQPALEEVQAAETLPPIQMAKIIPFKAAA